MWRGYGQFRFVDVHGKQCVARAHRLAYEFEHGPIPQVGPDGAAGQIDHMCHDPAACDAGHACPHRACCNPFHMRLSSNAENHRPGRVNGRTGGLASATARWSNPEARTTWSRTKKQWWADLTPERRAEIKEITRRARWGRDHSS